MRQNISHNYVKLETLARHCLANEIKCRRTDNKVGPTETRCLSEAVGGLRYQVEYKTNM